MDDQSDREYSRTPQLPDLIKICKSLNEQGVKYLLIGGFAVILHGFIRGTKDIDFLVNSSEENIRKAKKALSILPDNAIALIMDDEVSKYGVVRVADEVVVDLMAKACGIDYEQAKEGIVWMEVEGIKIPVADKAWLIRMKDTIRPSDKMDVNYLLQVIEEENLQAVYFNGIKQNNPVDIKTSSPLGVGRNVFQLVGYTTPEAKMVSSEVRVLRIRPFSDVPMKYWAIEPIALCVTLKLAGGYPDGTFKPEKGINRTELATMLARTLSASREESTVTAAAKQNKVLTRAEAITLITRYIGISEEATAKPVFADLPEKFWGNKYITPAARAGLLKYLVGKKFEPSKQFTRAEACEVLYQTPQVKSRVEAFWDKGIASFIAQPTTKEAGVKKVPITPSTSSPTTREGTASLTKEAATIQSSKEVK